MVGSRSQVEKLKARVLVVDDEEGIRLLLARFLNKFGFEVEEAEDGIKALDALQAGDFDYVITDLNMPRMGGYELIEACRDFGFQNTRFVITTGAIEFDESTSRSQGLLRADAFLQKPFDRDDILRVLQNLPINATTAAP